MLHKKVIKKLFLICIPAIISFVTGCVQPVQQPVEKCAGKINISEAAIAMNSLYDSALPLKARISCKIESKNSEGKTEYSHFDADLRFIPSEHLFFRGVMIGLGEIRLGTNLEEFWVRIKPQNTCWWGKRPETQQCLEGLWLNPYTISEALGVVRIDSDWMLSSIYGYDILTKTYLSGRPQKKITIECCKYRPEKIEYFGEDGEVILEIQMGDYISTDDGLTIPKLIEIINYQQNDTNIEMKLSDIRLYEPTEKDLKGQLFKNPGTKGYKNVYRLNRDCKWIRE